jgi:predicted O-methyltransferase YrrM
MIDIYRVKAYLRYLWQGHSRYLIHSPFVFSFINEIMRDGRHFYEFDQLSHLKAKLLQNRTPLHIKELGGGPQKGAARTISVKELVSKTALPEKYGKLLFRMVNHFQPHSILEIGAGSGISTAYLSCARKKAHIITLEGNEETAALAKANFQALNLENISLLKGNFDDCLPGALQTLGKLDLAFIDGNHTPEATLRYFRQCLEYSHGDTILIFDDINWSEGMNRAWMEITRHERVKLSIDLYKLGIVFFREEFKKQEYKQLYF